MGCEGIFIAEMSQDFNVYPWQATYLHQATFVASPANSRVRVHFPPSSSPFHHAGKRKQASKKEEKEEEEEESPLDTRHLLKLLSTAVKRFEQCHLVTINLFGPSLWGHSAIGADGFSPRRDLFSFSKQIYSMFIPTKCDSP